MYKAEKYQDLNYIVTTPEGFQEGNRYPLIFFLHGAGSRGTDVQLVWENPFFSEVEKHHLPAVIAAPQCSTNSWFDLLQELQSFVKFFVNRPFVDPERVYIVGASMGGYATWQLAMSLPELFAAIVPICGGGMYWNAGRLKQIPVWAFHGSEDKTVLPEESVHMVDAVNKNGGNAKLTMCQGVGHNVWNVAYSDKAVFDWLLSQKKGGVLVEENRYNNQQQYG